MSDKPEKNDRAQNPGTNPGELVPQPHGGAIKRGGVNPGSGRPPDEFRARMRALATREDTEAYLDRCLRGEFGPKVYDRALRYVTEHGYGKAVQPITGADGEPLFKAIVGVDVDKV